MTIDQGHTESSASTVDLGVHSPRHHQFAFITPGIRILHLYDWLKDTLLSLRPREGAGNKNDGGDSAIIREV